jgi:predicted  nucleic acid-binding Zn-ribbon protein
VESKLDNMNTQLTETVAAQTKTMDEMKAGFDELKTLSDEQEVRIKKAERYIASIKKSMKNFDTEVEGIQGTTSRHEEWLKKDLEAKKAELEKLTSVISELENILSGEKTSK